MSEWKKRLRVGCGGGGAPWRQGGNALVFLQNAIVIFAVLFIIASRSAMFSRGRFFTRKKGGGAFAFEAEWTSLTGYLFSSFFSFHFSKEILSGWRLRVFPLLVSLMSCSFFELVLWHGEALTLRWWCGSHYYLLLACLRQSDAVVRPRESVVPLEIKRKSGKAERNGRFFLFFSEFFFLIFFWSFKLSF